MADDKKSEQSRFERFASLLTPKFIAERWRKEATKPEGTMDPNSREELENFVLLNELNNMADLAMKENEEMIRLGELENLAAITELENFASLESLDTPENILRGEAFKLAAEIQPIVEKIAVTFIDDMKKVFNKDAGRMKNDLAINLMRLQKELREPINANKLDKIKTTITGIQEDMQKSEYRTFHGAAWHKIKLAVQSICDKVGALIAGLMKKEHVTASPIAYTGSHKTAFYKDAVEKTRGVDEQPEAPKTPSSKG